MFRGLLFLLITIPYLYILDVWILLIRLFRPKQVLPFLNWKTQPWGHGVINLMRLFTGLKIQNDSDKELIKKLPERFLAVSNHQSLFDIVLIFDIFPNNQMRFVAKKELGRGFPGASQVLRLQHHALIDRKSNFRQTLQELKRLALYNRKQGNCSVIFPEGHRSKTGDLGAFNSAGFKTLLDADPCPIVVVALDGGYKIAKIFDFLRSKNDALRYKVLGVLECPRNKEDIKNSLEQSRILIDQQLKTWRQTKEA